MRLVQLMVANVVLPVVAIAAQVGSSSSPDVSTPSKSCLDGLPPAFLSATHFQEIPNPVCLVALVRLGATWHAALRDTSNGQIDILGVGSTGIGYRLKEIDVDEGSVLLERAGWTFRLNVAGSILNTARSDTLNPRLSLSKTGTPVSTSAEIALVGVGDVGRGKQAAIRDVRYGDIAFASEGDAIFGYRLEKIADSRDAVLVSRFGHHYWLSTGDRNRSVGEVASPIGPTPQWIREWQQQIAGSAPEKQQAGRDQMREYFGQLWAAGLAEAVSTLKPEEQIAVRLRISSFWKQ